MRKIIQVGDGTGMLLPKKFLLQFGVSIGDYVAIEALDHDTIIVRKVQPEKLTDEQIIAARELPVIQNG